MKDRYLRHTFDTRGFWATTAIVLLFTLAACGGRLSLPQPVPTAQPVAILADQVDPTITLSPPSGYAGLYIQVSGAKWPPNMIVVIVLSDPSGISTTVATKDTDEKGSLSTGFLYPIDARWLMNDTYTVVAESADGQYQATSQFTVVEPGTKITPTTAATNTVPSTATPMPTAAQPSATPVSATITPIPTAVPTAQPIVESVPTPQASVDIAAPATGNRPPVVSAAFIPDGDGSKPHEQFHVEITASDPDDNLMATLAILQFPLLSSIEDVQLKVKDKIEIKMDKGKLEISAPDPQALFDSIQQRVGIEVQPGQRIEYKVNPDQKFKIEFDKDLLKIEASTLLLQVTAVDGAGLSSQVTVSPLAPTDNTPPGLRDNPGRGNSGNNNGQGNDDGENHDDNEDDDHSDDD